MRQRLVAVVRLALVATLAAAGLWFGGSYAWAWWDQGRFEEGTDNAYVRGEVTPIAPKVAGYVVAVPVDDNQMIRAGDVLFRIDNADYQARVAQAEAEVVAAIAEQQRAAVGARFLHRLSRPA